MAINLRLHLRRGLVIVGLHLYGRETRCGGGRKPLDQPPFREQIGKIGGKAWHAQRAYMGFE
jgi:hypothetical protein